MSKIRWDNVNRHDRTPEYQQSYGSGHTGVPILKLSESCSIIACDPCGFNHVVPLPTMAENDEYYRESFYQESKPLYVVQYQQDFHWWFQTHQNVMDEYIEGRETFFDLGFGPGIAMDVAKSLGLRTSGIEVNQLLVDLALERGHEAICGQFEDFHDSIMPQSIIYMWEVLEHSPCPEQLLMLIWDKLEDDGVLILEVPNDFSPLQKRAMDVIQSSSPWWVSSREHLNYFNKNDLKTLLRRTGFDILDMYGTYPLELFLINGKDYTKDSNIGRTIHRERMELEMKAYVSRNATHMQKARRRDSITMSDIGREIVCICKKRN